MQVWPLRFRPTGDAMLFADEAGGWFRSTEDFLERYVAGRLTAADLELLAGGGHAFERDGDLRHSAFLRRWSARHAAAASDIGYVILVPTLRCNLSCNYCQVSRASEAASGYDWDEAMLQQVISFLDRLDTRSIKIEFQGGEPLLRMDHLRAVREFCRARFSESRFVVCSNFQRVDDAAWEFFADEDTTLSTSIDGPLDVQTRQRTHDQDQSVRFFANVGEFVARFGSSRISALPTVDIFDPPDFDDLIETYRRFGLNSIYLRPINRQGFAKRQPARRDDATTWAALHGSFIDHLVARNFGSSEVFEEYYFSHVLRRVMRPGVDGHVDIRNPNPLGADYVVVDQTGTIFPTDEARMMARVGQIDMSIGHVSTGLDQERIDQLNLSAVNDFDPDCRHCTYQPFCGVDRVDDVSRHGRFDLPRHETWFCQRHLALFDKIFEMVTSTDPAVLYSMAKWAGVERWPSHLSEVHR